ncbi:MAG: AAA-associated domain-containing protein [Caldisphaeraceae archaeon]|nr:AAA-associated domain-containing protein [Caldisphaeraceae archaeon]MEB3691317.1 AAA-associated domain-containing protein [Caldisphaeraceae archaeon]
MTYRNMKLFPLVYVDQVMGLLDYIQSVGGRVDSSRLGELLGVDLDLLPHVVDAALILGLLREENGDLVLTEIGRKSINTEWKDFRILMKSINKNIEPFKDVLSVQKKGKINIEDLKKILEKNGYSDVENAATIIAQWLTLIGIEIVE